MFCQLPSPVESFSHGVIMLFLAGTSFEVMKMLLSCAVLTPLIVPFVSEWNLLEKGQKVRLIHTSNGIMLITRV